MKISRLALAALTAAAALPAAAQAQGPPPPTTTDGRTAETVLPAGSIPTPTSFAFGAGKLFVGAGGDEEDGNPPGGIFTDVNGTVTRLPSSPAFVAGLVWHKGVLYVSGDNKLLAYRGWDGSSFKTVKTIFKGPKHFPGFGGLAWHKGRIYAGTVISNFRYDSRKSPQPYAQSVVSLKPNGKGIRVIAEGLRQPWQLTFVRGIGQPFVSVLGQDNLKKNPPPDYIIRARSGQDYGFPTCNWLSRKACKPFAKPYKLLAPHSSPMGIGSIGKTIYVALFGKMEIDRFKVGGGKPKAFLKGYVAPVVALATNAGWVYTGDLTGAVYRIKP